MRHRFQGHLLTVRYMLDTNIVSEIIRNPAGRAAQRARERATRFASASSSQPNCATAA